MRDFQTIMTSYCAGVSDGTIPACVWLKKAVRRFLKDREREESDAFPFFYNAKAADAAMAFAEELKPADLNGARLSLLPWQVFCFANLEGWRHKADPGRRRFRSAYIEVNRKNGKTTGLLLPLVLYNFLKYRSSESYIVSSRDDLAEKTFKEVQAIIKADPRLDSLLDCKSLAVTFRDKAEASRLGFFCDGGKSADGFKPRFFCLDEYHEYATDRMLDSMMMGMRSKKDAQGVMITTADTDTAVPCYEQHLKARRILNGLQSQEEFFTVMYALDDGDDWHNPDVWKKANPSLGGVIDPSVIQSDIENAELTPHKIPELKAKTFGIWGGGSERAWLPVEVWQRNRDVPVDWNDFSGAVCYGGLDLAQVDDLCAFTLCFPHTDGRFYFRHRFYIPEATAYTRYRKENVNFLAWIEQGVITATPGATVDYGYILRDILRAAQLYRLPGIGFDRWQARDVIQGIEEERPDIFLIEVEQSLKKLSPLTKAYEKAIKDGLVVDNNPAMLWMVNNVEVRPDANGNYKPLKKSKASGQHIDGVISAIMAHGVSQNEAFRDPVSPVDYDTLKAMLL